MSYYNTHLEDEKPEKIQPVEPVAEEIRCEPEIQMPIIEQRITSPKIENQPVELRQTTNSIPRTLIGILSAVLIILFFFTPFRVTTLVLGIDRPPKGTWAGRSDTMILTSIPAFLPQVSMLSIPRDLWVTLQNNSVNRINAAHYFAELEVPGSGMQGAADAIKMNFGVDVDYVVRLKFDGFIDVVDAMGGVTVDLPEDMSGMTAGKHHLDGTQALAFVRDRKGSDDFFRQQRGQLFIKAAIKSMFNPLKWPRIPAIIAALGSSVETDLPVWLWPRVGYSLLFSVVKGFDSYAIDRNMVTPWMTDEGAQVLLPNWDQINPLIFNFLH